MDAGTDPTGRVRRDVRSLIADGDPAGVLPAYGEAIRIMRELDLADGDAPPTNPLGWRFQAAIHGISDEFGVEISNDPTWNSCRHNSWFFHAWHRIYLTRFEQIVQRHLGDDAWALPYWDYTNLDDEDARRLPAPFRDSAPGNQLFTTARRAEINDGRPLPRQTADAWLALAVPDFALPRSDVRPTFGGGIVEDVTPIADARGSLEGTPHGTVHGTVGGWMGRFDTAALDPIFWLHHANIDRLWDVWLGLGFVNPPNDTWVRTSFRFYDADGRRTRTRIGDILDTRALGYTYESIEPPPGIVRRLRREGLLPARGEAPAVEPDAFAKEAPRMPSPELVGAMTDVPFDQTTTVAIELEPPRRQIRAVVGRGDGDGDDEAADAATAENPDERWYLRVENLVGRPEAAAYAIYLDPDGPGSEEPRHIGTVAAFGIMEASRTSDTRDGTGVTDVFDITESVRELAAAGAWNPSRASVTITPIGMRDEPVRGGDVRAGRVSFFRG